MNLFKYESAISQALLKIADMIILNLLYLLCCVPIFTMGAAQAGLYTAAKVMLDKEDDRSVISAYWRGFRAGFGTITLCWGLVSLLVAIMVYFGVMAVMLGMNKWMLLIPLSIIMVYQTLLPAFHSRFGCTFKQLFRNTLFLMLYYPFQSFFSTLLLWLPVILAYFLKLYTFMAMAPIWLTLYYSTAILTSYMLLRKPFDILVEDFNETHGIEPPKPPKEEELYMEE